MTFASASDWFLLSPELFLTAAGLLILVARRVRSERRRRSSSRSSRSSPLGGHGRAPRVRVGAPGARRRPILGGMFVVDNFAIFFKVADPALDRPDDPRLGAVRRAPRRTRRASTTRCSSSPASGMLFMVSGTNLISIYVALELMALSSYILAGYFKGEVKSTEAALKYFVLGAFSSGVLLYGLSLVYGVAGKMGLPELAKLFAADGAVEPAHARDPADPRGPALQDRRGAVPRLDARRLRGRADAGDGVLLGRPEGRRLRDPRAHLLRRRFRSSTPTGG